MVVATLRPWSALPGGAGVGVATPDLPWFVLLVVGLFAGRPFVKWFGSRAAAAVGGNA